MMLQEKLKLCTSGKNGKIKNINKVSFASVFKHRLNLVEQNIDINKHSSKVCLILARNF